MLGIFGYTYGSLLGIFLVGMITRTRGSYRGNLLAMLAGFIVVAILSGLPNDLAKHVRRARSTLQPEWLPVIEFPWRIAFGTVVTFAVALCFRTPPEQLREDARGPRNARLNSVPGWRFSPPTQGQRKRWSLAEI